MKRYVEQLKDRRRGEQGVTLPEVIVTMGLLLAISTIFLIQFVTMNGATIDTIQANDDTNAYANVYQSFRTDVMNSRTYAAPVTADTVELEMWDKSLVRYRFDTNEEGVNILTREQSPTPGVRDYLPPVVKASDFSDGFFASEGAEVSTYIGDLQLISARIGKNMPLGDEKSQEQVNAEHMLQQDVQLAMNKEGSTEQLLLLELEDGSFVQWSFDGTRLLRGTTQHPQEPFVDERVMMTGISGGSFSYDFYATRDITLHVGDHETTFTIPLRAPNISQ